MWCNHFLFSRLLCYVVFFSLLNTKLDCELIEIDMGSSHVSYCIACSRSGKEHNIKSTRGTRLRLSKPNAQAKPENQEGSRELWKL